MLDSASWSQNSTSNASICAQHMHVKTAVSIEPALATMMRRNDVDDKYLIIPLDLQWQCESQTAGSVGAAKCT